jgi:hypothetical protein
MSYKEDVVAILTEEIRVAEKKLQPHDTGYIHTAISYMKERIEELKEELNQDG